MGAVQSRSIASLHAMHVKAAMGDTVLIQGYVICLNEKNVSSMSPTHNTLIPHEIMMAKINLVDGWNGSRQPAVCRLAPRWAGVSLICNRHDNGTVLLACMHFLLLILASLPQQRATLPEMSRSWPGIHYQVDMAKRHRTSSMRFISSWSRSE
jgi:hypothetical protein